ncbi:hypothetical protein [Neisseria wadsworthii]|uniref:Uncharacterized protein n=1 Tax=Neisseria wadsworthii 9715 TaxID=1030841 RepID=G4CP03_9NEIS|nr:hypothetical protein [Neisseria wadsworthii]EGZ48517.1 hypothetical protein HMPREF9370_0812 [Neisseria wadsworthii 9715]
MSLKKYIPSPCRPLILFPGTFIPLLIAGEIGEHLLAHERFAFEQPLMLTVHHHTRDSLPTYLAIALH